MATPPHPQQQPPLPASSPTPPALHLRITFSSSKFHNTISAVHDTTLTPLYTQSFSALKPQSRFSALSSGTPVRIGTGTANLVAIDSECVLHGRKIELKPLKRWKSEYNYLSDNLHPSPSASNAPTQTQTLTPITWRISASLSTMTFTCLYSASQLPIARLVVNVWAVKTLGDIYFVGSAEEVGEKVRDEVVVTGLTLMYVMAGRTSPLSLLGSLVARPGRVEGGDAEGQEEGGRGKSKRV